MGRPTVGDNKTARGILAMVKNAASDDLQRYRAETLLQNLEAGEQSEQALREYRELQSRLAAEAAANHSPDSPVADDNEDAFDAPPVLARKTAPAGADGPVIETAKPQVTRPGGLQLEGSLTMMDCSKGLTLHVRVGNQAVQLHTDTPEQLELVSFIAAVSDTIPCGTLSPALPVRVVYKRGADLRFLGEPVRIEFVDDRK
jgi:hypothetical protein